MPIDVSELNPESREVYLELGRRVTTPNALAQAVKTRQAFVLYGPEVTADGYGPPDDARLGEVHDTLLDRYADRAEAKGAARLAMTSYFAAVRAAKRDRLGGRTLLTSCVTSLRDGGGVQDAKRVQNLLDETSAVLGDTSLLAHLKRMHAMLNDPMLAEHIADRGGPAMIVRIQGSRAGLLAAIDARAAHPEISALADERDILDGMIVTLTRTAARAARVAARRLGQRAIAHEFRLVHLRSSRSAPPDAAPEPGAPATADPGTDPGADPGTGPSTTDPGPVAA